VTKLKELIARSINPNQLHSWKSVKQLISAAVCKEDAKFDYMDASFQGSDVKKLAELVIKTYYLGKQKVNQQGDNKLFKDFLLAYIARSGTPPHEVINVTQQKLLEIVDVIRMHLPCTATKQYDTEVIHCESTFGCHGDVHQSSQTYKDLFVPGDPLPQACRWTGSYEASKEYIPVDPTNMARRIAVELNILPKVLFFFSPFFLLLILYS
jgi:hypothetical protein